MTQKELMRQEIERRKKVYLTKNGFPKGTFGAIKIETYEGLLAFIDSLPEETENHGCGVEFPHFGANYPDAKCIDGYLWDMDSYENGIYTIGGDDPCPICNTEKWLKDVLDDEIFKTRDEALEYVRMLKSKYKYKDSLPDEKPSDDLEEAAKEYADKHGFRVPYDGSNNYYDDVDVKASKEGFLAGAEWMRKKDVEDMYMSDNRHFLKCYEQGKVDMKVEMMKDAVEAEITVGRLPDDWSLSYNPDELHRALLKFKSGDKVKIIIVKQ